MLGLSPRASKVFETEEFSGDVVCKDELEKGYIWFILEVGDRGPYFTAVEMEWR